MQNIINYRGKVLTFNVEKGVNKNFISEVQGLETKKVVSIGHQTNNNTGTLSIDYLSLVEVDGNVIESSINIQPKIIVKGSYDKFYAMSGEFGELVNAELNGISEIEYGYDCIAFNPLKGFENMQPITMDFITSETGVTVDVIDKPIDAVLLYCIGDPTSPDANWLPLPSTEIPLSSGTYPFFVINQSDGYPFGSDKAFTI